MSALYSVHGVGADQVVALLPQHPGHEQLPGLQHPVLDHRRGRHLVEGEVSRLLLLDRGDDRLGDGGLAHLLEPGVEPVVREHGLPLGARAGQEVEQLGDVLDRLEAGQRAEDLDLERDVQMRIGRRPAEILLHPVEDQPVLDLLGLPDVGVEGLVGVVHVGQQGQQLEHVAVDLELDPGEIVDDVAVALGDQRGLLDRPVDGVERDRRIVLTQSLNMLSDLGVADVLPGHGRHSRDPVVSNKVTTSAE